ncbi:MAG: signal recognition particle receptor subunit alpha, partial [Candidatus Binatia bacterium]
MEVWPFSPETLPAAGAVAVAILAALLGFLVQRRRGAAGRRAIELRPAEPTPEPPPTGRVLGRALAKSRELVRLRLADVFGKDRELDAMLGALEEALVSADVGLATAARILKVVRSRCEGERTPSEAK